MADFCKKCSSEILGIDKPYNGAYPCEHCGITEFYKSPILIIWDLLKNIFSK